MELKQGDYIKLPEELKAIAKTSFDYGKIEKIIGNQIIEVILVEEGDVNKLRLHLKIEKKGLTFSFLLYDIHY